MFGSVGVFSGITPKQNRGNSDLHPLSDFMLSAANYSWYILMTRNGEQPYVTSGYFENHFQPHLS